MQSNTPMHTPDMHTPDPHSEWTVDWGDCDPAGIVFYPRYFAWFDRAAHRFFERQGLDHHAVQATYGAIGLSLVDAQARFMRPATFGDRLHAQIRLDAMSTRSLTLQHRILRGDVCLVEGREVRVWMVADGEGVAAAPIPDVVRRLLKGDTA